MRALFFFHPSLWILAALALALTAEYGFGILPCTYCVYQRYLFITAGILFLSKRTFWLAQFTLVVGFALSLYQLGLEHHVWQDVLKGCQTPSQVFDSVEAMRQALKPHPITRCDEVTWRMLGFSATFWIAVFQGFLILYAFVRRRLYEHV